MDFCFPNLALRLAPVLNGPTVLAASLLVQFIGTLGDLREQIGRGLGFDGIKNPIRQQFHAVIQEKSQQRIAPHEPGPGPTQWSHKQPIHRDQGRHDLRPEHGPP